MSVNTNDLLQAIDIVAESRVKKYQYDETIEAKIISTNRRSEGIYKVEYQNGKFDAYTSDSQTYYENEVVYVMVPKGDYTKQKYIIGRKVDEQTENATYSFNFKLPFDNFVGLENLTYGQTFETKGYLANHPYHGVYTDDTDTNMNDLNKIWHWERLDDNPVIETKLGIAADWRTLLGKYHPRRGVFGLRIDVTGMTKPVEGENAKEKKTIYYFTNNDMYGSTYAFYEPSQQQIILDISDYLTLNTVDIWFYQDRHFVDQYNRDIPYQKVLDPDPNVNNLPANLIVTNLQVLLGLTIDECKTDRVFLYTYDDMYYGYDPLRQLAGGVETSEQYLQDYSEYHDRYIAIQVSDDSVENKAARLEELVNAYKDVAGFEWIKMTRTLHFAWVHLDDGNPVLVNHYKKLSDNDTGAFEYWEEQVDAQLHWYHYELACAQNYDVLAERQGGVNWKYLGSTPEKSDSEQVDLESFDDYVVTPDTTRARDQWKAIVSVHNVPYTTDPLIFTNVDSTVETDGETLNEVTLRFLREEVVNSKQQLIDRYDRIVANGTDEDKQAFAQLLSFDHWDDAIIADKILSWQTEEYEGVVNLVEDTTLRDFYVYDENNRVLKDKDNFSYADRWYYVQIWIRNNDNGEYLPMTYEPGDNAYKLSVEWDWEKLDKIPGNSMIESWSIPTQEDLQNSVLAPTLLGASSVYNDQIINITRKFKIRDYLDLAYLNNTIGAVVYRHNKVYHPQIELHFGQAGSMGSAYTIQITQTAPEGQYMVENEEFALTAAVIEKGKTVAESANSKYIFSWQCLSPTIITRSQYEDIHDDDGNEKQEWDVNGRLNFVGNHISGYIRNNKAPIFKVSVLNAADYTIAATIGFRLINSASAAPQYVTNCPTKVEFKSDGTVPLTLMSEFSVFKLEDNLLNEVYPIWDLNQQYHAHDGWNNCEDYLKLKKEPHFDTAIATNTNPLIEYQIVENSDDVIDLDKPFKPGVQGNTHTTAYLNLQRAIMEAYDTSIGALDGTESNIVELKTNITHLRDQRLQNLNIAAAKIIPATTVYRLDPYIRNTTTTAGWYWEENMSNYYTQLTWTLTNDQGDSIVCSQAIPFTRNVYSSSLLNTWDGQLMIDEAENAILAQMISAGVKNSNNTFTGVVMGDWAEKADSSLDVPGLYGIKDGAQVFGFKVDGTGFIGKSGRGQIQFDGNQSLISNADKTMYLNLDPASYTYDVDGLTFKTYKSYSPYFLYAETKHTSTASIIGEDQLEFSTIWTQQFMNDTTKDYFIVDPNNGILTTGGIIARYGKIGNWMISDAGLYQKYTGTDKLTSRYMYLGYPTKNLSLLEQNHLAQINNLEQEKNNKLNILKTQYINNLNDEYYEKRAQIIQTYDDLLADTKKIQQNVIKQLIVNDKDQYMIFAGYTPTDTPLFSVNWRGQMTARAGRIGENSPWYITDNGLTQKNNSGIIFLGNPEASSQISDWIDDDSDIASNKFFANLALLPNDENGPIILGTSDPLNTPTHGKFAIYAGGSGYVTTYDKVTNGLIRQWENDAKIRFGVRMDGTLYASRGQIGGWTLTDSMLYAGNAEDPNSLLVLDSANGVINLGNAIVLNKDGTAIFGLFKDNKTVGRISIAGFDFRGENTGSFQYSVPTYSVSSGGSITVEKGSYDFWGSSDEIGAASIATQKNTSGTVSTNVHFTGLLRVLDSNYLSGNIETAVGVVLGTGCEVVNNVETSSHAVVIYPTVNSTETAVLGTNEHPWDIVAKTIVANTIDLAENSSLDATYLFMNHELVATELWVANQLSQVYAAIKQSAAGGSSAALRAQAGALKLAEGINTKFSGFLDFFDGKYFLDTYDNASETAAQTGALQWVITDGLPRIGVAAKKISTATQTDTTISKEKDKNKDVSGNVTLTLATTDTVLTSIVVSEWYVMRGSTYSKLSDGGKSSIASGLVKGLTFAKTNIPDYYAKYDKTDFDETTLKLHLAIQTDADSNNEFSYKYGAKLDLAHAHQPKIEWDDASGKLKITIENANFQKTSLTTDDNSTTLTITTTSWFKKRAANQLTIGDTTTMTRAVDATSSATIAGSSIKGLYSNKKIALTTTLTSHYSGTNLGSGTIYVDATDAYDAGWKAAAKTFKRNNNTVSGPSETPGQTWSMTASAQNNYWAEATYYYAPSDMTIPKNSVVYDGGAYLDGWPPTISWS